MCSPDWFCLLPLLFSGESGLGKSTLINSLFLTDLYSAEYPGPSHRIKKTVQVHLNKYFLWAEMSKHFHGVGMCCEHKKKKQMQKGNCCRLFLFNTALSRSNFRVGRLHSSINNIEMCYRLWLVTFSNPPTALAAVQTIILKFYLSMWPQNQQI